MRSLNSTGLWSLHSFTDTASPAVPRSTLQNNSSKRKKLKLAYQIPNKNRVQHDLVRPAAGGQASQQRLGQVTDVRCLKRLRLSKFLQVIGNLNFRVFVSLSEPDRLWLTSSEALILRRPPGLYKALILRPAFTRIRTVCNSFFQATEHRQILTVNGSSLSTTFWSSRIMSRQK